MNAEDVAERRLMPCWGLCSGEDCPLPCSAIEEAA